MRQIKFTVTMALLFNSALLFSQTESNSAVSPSEEIAQLNPSEAKSQNLSKPANKMEIKEESVITETIIETKLLPIKDLLEIDLPENSGSILVLQRNGKLVNEILCNPDDKKMAMDLSYLPKGNYSLQFNSNSQVLRILNFKKGRLRYQ